MDAKNQQQARFLILMKCRNVDLRLDDRGQCFRRTENIAKLKMPQETMNKEKRAYTHTHTHKRTREKNGIKYKVFRTLPVDRISRIWTV